MHSTGEVAVDFGGKRASFWTLKSDKSRKFHVLGAALIALSLIGVWKLTEPTSSAAGRSTFVESLDLPLQQVDVAGDMAYNFTAQFAAVDKYAASLTPPLVFQVKGTVFTLTKHYATGGITVGEITIPTEPPRYLQKIRFNGVVMPAYLEDENNTAEIPIGVWAKSARQLYPTTNDKFSSVNESIQWVDDVYQFTFPRQGDYATWSKVASDADMTQWAFFSIGAHLVRRYFFTDERRFGLSLPQRIRTVYISDVTALSLYAVRDGFVPFGAAAFFDHTKKIVAIYVSYLNRVFAPGDSGWAHAKFVWKSSIVAQVTFVDHFGHTHFVESNTLSIACRENLAADHPLRRFLKAHLFRTDTINRAGLTGAAGHGELFHATFSLTYDSVYSIAADFRKTYKYRPFINRIHENGMRRESDIEYPLKDIIPYWNAVHGYVKRYLNIYYENDAQLQADSEVEAFWNHLKWGLSLQPIEKKVTKAELGEVLTHLIVAVSALHNLYGTVVPVTSRADSFTSRVRAGQTEADIQALGAMTSMAASLAGKYPLIIDDYSFLFLQDTNHGEVMKSFKKFQNDLNQLSAHVTAKNQQRAYPFSYFDPQYVECSVSF